MSFHGIINLGRVDKEHVFLVGEIEIADYDRSESHIFAAEVESPCNFVESRDKHSIGTHFLHLSHYALNFR